MTYRVAKQLTESQKKALETLTYCKVSSANDFDRHAFEALVKKGVSCEAFEWSANHLHPVKQWLNHRNRTTQLKRSEIMTEAFLLRDGWHLILDGVMVPATWNTKGAALAAINVERKRRGKKGS